MSNHPDKLRNPQALSSSDAEMILRIKSGKATRIDAPFVFGRIASRSTPWIESQALLKGVLGHPETFNDEIIAEMLTAGIVRALKTPGINETPDPSRGPWLSDPMSVPELQTYRDNKPTQVTTIASLLLNRLIRTSNITYDDLSKLGLSILPHLFADRYDWEHFPDINNLHRKLLQGGIDMTEQFSQFALDTGKAMMVAQPVLANEKTNNGRLIFHSRFTAGKVYLEGGQPDKARQVIESEEIANVDAKRRLKAMYIYNVIGQSNAEKLPLIISEADEYIKETYDSGNVMDFDNVLMDFSIALLQNHALNNISEQKEQARIWLRQIIAFNTGEIPSIINKFFGNTETYIGAVIDSSINRARRPEFLHFVVTQLHTEPSKYQLTNLLFTDALLYIRDGHLSKPKIGLVEATATIPYDKEAKQKIFELARAIYNRGKKRDTPLEQRAVDDLFLEEMVNQKSVRELFGKTGNCFDNVEYLKLSKIARNARRRTRNFKAVASQLET